MNVNVISIFDDSENNFLYEGCEFVDLLDKETILDMSFEDEQCDAIDELLPFDVTTISLSLVEELMSFMVMFSISRRAMEYLLTILRRHGIDVPQMINSVKRNVYETNFETISMSDGNFAY